MTTDISYLTAHFAERGAQAARAGHPNAWAHDAHLVLLLDVGQPTDVEVLAAVRAFDLGYRQSAPKVQP
jgi:hypothetical protein